MVDWDKASETILNAEVGETITIHTRNRSGLELKISEKRLPQPPVVVVSFGSPPNHMQIQLSDGEAPKLLGPLHKDVAQKHGFEGAQMNVDGQTYIEFTEKITKATR